jgi:LacI family transcriptional regulator
LTLQTLQAVSDNEAMEPSETLIESVNAKKPPRPSLRTVAEQVDLSPTAVALALRGDESIPPETRQRILAAAKALNYEYTPKVRRSTSKRLRRLSYVMPDFGDRPLTANPFYGHLLVEAEQACQSHHASLNFVILQRNHPPTAELPPAITHDLDGILLASPYPDALIARIRKESGCPIVLLDHVQPDYSSDAVLNNDYDGGRQAIEHLIELGHTRIVTVSGKSRNVDFPISYRERYRGYAETCRAAGLNALPPAVMPDHLNERVLLNLSSSAHGEYAVWLRSVIEAMPQVTAFFCVGDYFALAMMSTLQTWGYRIPDNISVVGFDDFEMSSQATPPLTTIHSDHQAMARVAVQRVLDRVEGDDTPPHKIAIRTRLIIRSSTGPVPVPR